jgi:hypothetical protein
MKDLCRCGHRRELHTHDHDRTYCALSTCDCRAYRTPYRHIGLIVGALAVAAAVAAFGLLLASMGVLA